MNNLASTLRAQGDLPGALVLQQKVLEVSERVLGPEHPNTLASMNNLAGMAGPPGSSVGGEVTVDPTTSAES
jgi:hypothetical protein